MSSVITPLHQAQAVGDLATGTVIDHIPPGAAARLLRMLCLTLHPHAVTIGMNLPSSRSGTKDVIKIAQWKPSEREAGNIALFAPSATVSLVDDYRVVEKFNVRRPEVIHGIIVCPNSKCITNHEIAERKFTALGQRRRTRLQCYHCEYQFFLEEIQHYRF